MEPVTADGAERYDGAFMYTPPSSLSEASEANAPPASS